MKKIQQWEKPKLGGLAPINKKNIDYLVELTKEVLLHKTIMFWRDKPNNVVDKIEVYGVLQTKHSSGEIVKSKLEEKPLFVIKDKGAFVEFDRFEETLFNQADIDNPAYIKEYDESDPPKVIRIYYVDGQIDDGDGNMVDNEIDIEPYQKKGRKDPDSRVVVIEAKEPLAEIYANIGPYLKTYIKAEFNQRYNV